MQQRYAFALLIRVNHSPTEIGPETEKLYGGDLYGTVQAADAPEVTHFRSLRQLKRWLEATLHAHDAPLPL